MNAATRLASAGLILVCAAPSQQRTSPQRFFDWTRLAFAPAEYAARRAKMMAALTAAGGGVFLVPSVEGGTHGATFRQASGFLYFTGLELPRSILAIYASERRVELFVPATDRRFANPARRNDFPGRRLAGDPELATRSGIGRILPSSAFAKRVAAWAKADRTIYVTGERGGPLREPGNDLWTQRTRGDVLRAHLRAQHGKLRFRNAFPLVARLRMVKSPAEVAVLRRAAAITVDAIVAASQRIEPGVDERTLEGVLEARFKAGGAQRPAFSSIIKSGPNSLWPWRILAAHSDRRNRKMTAPDLVIFDVGCELDGYASDVGRTFPVGGTFTKRQRELLTMVTAVADAVLAAVRPGTTLRELQKVAFAAIPKPERPFMQTGLFFGHHIGLEVGDPSLPGIPLAPGMVFTVEPWYYNHREDLAVFVEDVILVKKTGHENLTAHLPRTPAALEAMVGR